MRGVYRAASNTTGATAAQTLLYLTAPSTAVIEILSVRVTNQDNDTGEQMHFSLNRIATLGSPTATTVTPKPTEEASSASSATSKGPVTASEPTYDSDADAIAKGGAVNLAGWEYVPLPEERPIIKPSDTVGLKLMETIASTDLTAEIIYREIG